MRIRKNAKLSPLLFSSSTSSSQGGGDGGSVPVVDTAFQAHVCQLNQSPWDVIPFDFDSIKFEVVDDRFNNGSAGNSFRTVENESVASMMDTIDDVAIIVLDDNHDNLVHGKKVAVDNNGYNKGLGKKKKKNLCCNAKNLLCKNNGVKQGRHLSLLRSQSHNNNSNNSTVKNTTQPPVVVGSRRGRPRAATKKVSGSGSSSCSNPNEFYYYSGFGPLWGKRRGEKNGEASKNISSNGGDSTMLESNNVNVNVDNVVVCNDVVRSSSEINNGVFDFVDDDEEEDCDNGKKRMRKPVKERSLKSLM